MAAVSEDNILRGPRDDTRLPRDGLARYLLTKMVENGDKVAQVFPEVGGLSLTFSDLARRSMLVARRLSRLGLKRGDVVVAAILARPIFTPFLIGSIAHGAVMAPVNPKFDHHDRKHVLSQLRPKLLISENPGWFDADASYQQLTASEVSAWFDEEDDGEEAELKAFLSGDVDNDHLLDTTALILCSSGTTGFPKGVSISHRAVLQQLVIATRTKALQLGEGAFLLITPVFWVSAITVQFMAMNSGCRMAIMAEYDEELFLKILKPLRIVGTLMSPHVGVNLSRRNPLPDVTPMYFIVFAGSPLSTSTQVDIRDKLKVKTTQTYGMTELLMVVGDGITPIPPGSVGKVAWNAESKVLDTVTGLPVGPNQEGELCFRGPTVTKGYYNDPEATARALDSDGWFHTGDIGYYDQEGFFFITDRIKDLVKYRGEHVPSTEIESILLEHPDVLEAAVIGVPEPVVVELPRAYVALKQGAKVTEQDIISYIEKTVADHKRLRGGVVFMDKLPRLVTGKLNKRVLREMVKKELEQKRDQAAKY